MTQLCKLILLDSQIYNNMQTQSQVYTLSSWNSAAGVMAVLQTAVLCLFESMSILDIKSFLFDDPMLKEYMGAIALIRKMVKGRIYKKRHVLICLFSAIIIE